MFLIYIETTSLIDLIQASVILTKLLLFIDFH